MIIAPGFARARRALAGVRIRERLAPAVHLCRASIARSPRKSTAPQHRVPEERRLRRRTTADAIDRSISSVPAGRPSPAASGDAADDRFGVADSAFAFVRVASRPGFPLQSPLRSDFRCNPSRLRSLTLAARPLLGGSLRSPPVAWSPPRCPASAQWQFHRRSRSRWRCAPRSSPAAPSRIDSPRRYSLSRTPPCSPRAGWRPLSRRGGSPSVPFPEPHPLSFGTSDRVISQPTLARLSHRTHRWCPPLHARALMTAGVRLRRQEISTGRKIGVIVA